MQKYKLYSILDWRIIYSCPKNILIIENWVWIIKIRAFLYKIGEQSA